MVDAAARGVTQEKSMSGFVIFPAIDLRHGRVVRLSQGRDDAQTIYGEDPVAVAQAFEAAGAQALHVVDLDAAFGDGNNRNPACPDFSG